MQVVGVSTDDHKTQCAFAESVGATYPMISDADGRIARDYDVFWPFIKLVRRVTFLIDEQGLVRGVFRHELAIGKHVDDVVAAAKRLKKRQGAGA